MLICSTLYWTILCLLSDNDDCISYISVQFMIKAVLCNAYNVTILLLNSNSDRFHKIRCNSCGQYLHAKSKSWFSLDSK